MRAQKTLNRLRYNATGLKKKKKKNLTRFSETGIVVKRFHNSFTFKSQCPQIIEILFLMSLYDSQALTLSYPAFGDKIFSRKFPHSASIPQRH